MVQCCILEVISVNKHDDNKIANLNAYFYSKLLE